MDEYLKAGKIAREAKEYAKSLIKPGIKLLELADNIENFIKKQGGGIAFPVNLSLNEIAAHHVPAWNETLTLKEQDILKVDIGVHVNGYIADTAFTVSFNPDRDKLIKASQEALNNAIKIIKPGTTLAEIGKTVQQTVSSYGFQPIRNLAGHSLDQYNLHAGLSIPNFDNKSKTKIEDGMALAIEPFATTGKGLVVETNTAEVYKHLKTGPTRYKEILTHIEKNYRTLPFAKRWLVKKFGPLKTQLAIRELVAKGILHRYKELKEVSNGLVSQAEHTIIIQKDKIKVTT
jgi:methionyl aminopeptidase